MAVPGSLVCHVLEASEGVGQGELTRTPSPATRSSDPPTPPHVTPTRSPLPPPSSSPPTPESCLSWGLDVPAPQVGTMLRPAAIALRLLLQGPSHHASLESSPSSLSQPQDTSAPFPFSTCMSATKIPRVHPTLPLAPRVKPCFVPGIVLHAPLHSFSTPSLGGRYSDFPQLGPGEVPALCGCVKPGSDWAVGFIPGLQSLHFAHHTSSLLLVGRARPQRTEGALTLVDFPSGPNTFG